MGVDIIQLLKRHEIKIDDLKGRSIVIDAPNHLYQFLTTIRGPDGSLFTDSKGRTTSHLIGLFSRTTNLMSRGLKIAYVFDGEVPKLKHKELARRKELKIEAEKMYRQAIESKDEESARRYAGRFSRLDQEMISESKRLLAALGLPCLDAPSEAEAQASHIVKKGDAYAVSSQDADCLMFGAKRLVRNLSITGRKKKAGKAAYEKIEPELIDLDENLSELGINREQLIIIGMLTGTDFNKGGVKGIGPKKGLALIQKHKMDFEAIFKEAKWSDTFEESWETIFEIIMNMPVSDNYRLEWKAVNREEVLKLLCDEHDFSEERVKKTLDNITTPVQKDLGGFI